MNKVVFINGSNISNEPMGFFCVQFAKTQFITRISIVSKYWVLPFQDIPRICSKYYHKASTSVSMDIFYIVSFLICSMSQR